MSIAGQSEAASRNCLYPGGSEGLVQGLRATQLSTQLNMVLTSCTSHPLFCFSPSRKSSFQLQGLFTLAYLLWGPPFSKCASQCSTPFIYFIRDGGQMSCFGNKTGSRFLTHHLKVQGGITGFEIHTSLLLADPTSSETLLKLISLREGHTPRRKYQP